MKSSSSTGKSLALATGSAGAGIESRQILNLLRTLRDDEFMSLAEETDGWKNPGGPLIASKISLGRSDTLKAGLGGLHAFKVALTFGCGLFLSAWSAVKKSFASGANS